MEYLIHSIKIALACLLGFAIIQFTHLQGGQWLIVTILVVTCAQINVGSVLQKSYMRFLGTSLGSLIAVLILLTIGINPWTTACAITLSAMLFSYLATREVQWSEAGTLGAVTVAIILLTPHVNFLTAAERFLELSVGLLVAAVVSQFVLPIHARTHLNNNQANTLRQLSAYYAATLLVSPETSAVRDYQKLDEEIIQSLLVQRKLAKESVREMLGPGFSISRFYRVLQSEREILRNIGSMNHAYDFLPDHQKALFEMAAFKSFGETVCHSLDQLADCFSQNLPTHNVTLPATAPLKEAMAVLTTSFQKEHVLYVDAFLFSADMLVEEIKKLKEV